jgi:hypothetical protein
MMSKAANSIEKQIHLEVEAGVILAAIGVRAGVGSDVVDIGVVGSREVEQTLGMDI